MTLTHLILGIFFLLMVDIIADWKFDHEQAVIEDAMDSQ